MSTTNLNISVIEKRMFKETEAASYAGLPVKHFKITCPVQPIQLRQGVLTKSRGQVKNGNSGGSERHGRR